jgi:hypothetical protein
MGQGFARGAALALLALAAGCGKGPDAGAPPPVFDYTKVNVGTDSKALIYNLIGRWFPKEEVERLDDDTLTPEAWCEREPARVEVHLDEVEVHCDDGLPTAKIAIARVERGEAGVAVVMRAAEDARLRTLTFERVTGTEASIAGVPCFGGESHVFLRFPRFEILKRQILGGRRCSQVVKDEGRAVAPPSPDDSLEGDLPAGSADDPELDP